MTYNLIWNHTFYCIKSKLIKNSQDKIYKSSNSIKGLNKT